jgi:hypothetical protein
MRALTLATLLFASIGPRAGAADPLPSGTIEGVASAVSGTGADATRLGFGYQYGWRAAWQPMSSDRSFGYTLRWLTMFGAMYNAEAARLAELRMVLMDFTAGVRWRP